MHHAWSSAQHLVPETGGSYRGACSSRSILATVLPSGGFAVVASQYWKRKEDRAESLARCRAFHNLLRPCDKARLMPQTRHACSCCSTYLASRHVLTSLCTHDSHCLEKKANVPSVQTAALLTVNKPQPLASGAPHPASELRGRPGGRCTRAPKCLPAAEAQPKPGSRLVYV